MAQRSMMLVAQGELLLGQLEVHTQKLLYLVEHMTEEDTDNVRSHEEGSDGID